MARRTREEAEQTRCRILDTAEALFSTHGVSRTTLATIASAAGLTRGAVYWHFENKLDLYRAMLDRIIPNFDTHLGELKAGAAHNPAAALWRFSNSLLRSVTLDARLQRVLQVIFLRTEHVDELAPVQDECIAKMREAHSTLTQILLAAQVRGQLQPLVQPMMAAQSLQALHDGLLRIWLADAQRFDLARDTPALLSCLYAGLFRPEVLEQLSPHP